MVDSSAWSLNRRVWGSVDVSVYCSAVPTNDSRFFLCGPLQRAGITDFASIFFFCHGGAVQGSFRHPLAFHSSWYCRLFIRLLLNEWLILQGCVREQQRREDDRHKGFLIFNTSCFLRVSLGWMLFWYTNNASFHWFHFYYQSDVIWSLSWCVFIIARTLWCLAISCVFSPLGTLESC